MVTAVGAADLPSDGAWPRRLLDPAELEDDGALQLLVVGPDDRY